MATNTSYATRRRRANFSGRGLDYRQNVVAGAAANTNMTLTGIRPGKDIIVSVITISTAAAGAFVDDTANTTIYAADVIRSTTNNTGRSLLVSWIKT